MRTLASHSLKYAGANWMFVERAQRGGQAQPGGAGKRLPKFKFSAKFPIGLHVILQIQIKKFENDCYIMWKIILTENPSRCNLTPSGVARAFPGGRAAHPENQNEEENEKSLRKNKINWSKFEEKMRKVELLPARDCEAGYGPACTPFEIMLNGFCLKIIR